MKLRNHKGEVRFPCPDELKRKLKSEAALNGETFANFVTRLLREAVGIQSGTTIVQGRP